MISHNTTAPDSYSISLKGVTLEKDGRIYVQNTFTGTARSCARAKHSAFFDRRLVTAFHGVFNCCGARALRQIMDVSRETPDVATKPNDVAT